MSAVSDRISRALGEAQMTQTQLAALAEVSPKTVYNVLSGTHAPSRAVLHRLADAIGSTPEWIEHGKGPMFPRDGVVHPEGVDCPNPSRGHGRHGEDMTLQEAVRVIARHLEVPEERVTGMVADLMREGSKGSEGGMREEHEGQRSQGRRTHRRVDGSQGDSSDNRCSGTACPGGAEPTEPRTHATS